MYVILYFPGSTQGRPCLLYLFDFKTKTILYDSILAYLVIWLLLELLLA